jgi:ABC-2 type transport system permease protein
VNELSTRNFRRLASLTFTLAVTDFKARYYGNAFGYLWALAKPLLMFGVLYVVFTKIFPVTATGGHYPTLIITGLVLYNYFSETTGQGLTSLVSYNSLIRKVPVPLLVIPLAIALRAFLTLSLNLIAVGVFLALGHVPVIWSWLEFPLLLAVLLIYSTAVAALLADLYVPFRDMSSIWEIGLQLMFWGSPIIYTIDRVPQPLRDIILMNPLAVIISQTGHALIDPSIPAPTQAMSNPALIVIPIAIVLAVLAASTMLYRWITPRIAEQL